MSTSLNVGSTFNKGQSGALHPVYWKNKKEIIVFDESLVNVLEGWPFVSKLQF